MPSVDVIIPTYNRHARLERTLRALSRQTFQDFRVFVGDDASEPPVAPATTAGASPVAVIRSERNTGPAASRNAAVAAGTGELLAFVDDDVDPAPEWLARHVAAHAGGKRVASFGPLLAPRGWRPTPWNWWEAATLAREYRRMREGLYEPTCRQFFTGNAMVRRDDFEAAGGFDAALSRAEDVELGLRLAERGVSFVFLPDAIGWHYSRRTFAAWRRMARQYSSADVRIAERHPEAHWLEMLDDEMEHRSRPLLLARRAGAWPAGERVIAGAVAAGSRIAFGVGMRDMSSRLLSVLYDVTYWNELRRLRSAA